MRDYGTGAWDGGDPDCDHFGEPFRTKATINANCGTGADVKNAEDRQPFKATCGKCGATRVDQQLGLEATPDLFVAAMVDVFREVKRVLRRDGTCWVNLGDSYASQPAGNSPDKPSGFSQKEGRREGGAVDVPTKDLRTAGLKPKDLVGIPWRVAFALQADGWYVRSDIVWAKPNPMPESVTDRPTKAHEYVFLLTKSPRYFFDQEAVREPAQDRPQPAPEDKTVWTYRGKGINNAYAPGASGYGHHPAGRNVRSVWEIATQPYPEAHFATFPEALPERCIKAGTSERGCCPECGAPWVREYERSGFPDPEPQSDDLAALRLSNNDADRRRVLSGQRHAEFKAANPDKFLGWKRTCEHDWQLAISPCTVLDPFMGSGTTALVARRLGRRSIGIELNPDYAALCAKRLQQLSLFAGEPT